MAYLTPHQIANMGFKKVGKGVQLSDKASFYDCDRIEIGDYSRVDDFCVISGLVKIGDYCHITPMCLIAGGTPGVFISDYCTLAYGVKIFSQSDDYSGESLTNSLIPKEFKNEIFSSVTLEKFVIVGAGATIMPGANIGQGCAVGAMSLVLSSTDPWGIYVGIPARRIKDRSRVLLEKYRMLKSKTEQIIGATQFSVDTDLE